MTRKVTFEAPTATNPDFEAIQNYLRTGHLSARLLGRSLTSVVVDPVLSILTILTGPLGFFLRQLFYRPILGKMGSNVHIDVGVFMYGCRNIQIGDFTWIDSYSKLIAPYGGISIGKRVHVSTGAYLSGAGGIVIEDYAGLAPRAIILSSTEYPVAGKRMSGPMLPIEYRGLKQGPVVLKKDSFVGSNGIIMPGVTLGEGAVVAANSIVTKDVEPFTIVSGCPARPIGHREPVTVPDL